MILPITHNTLPTQNLIIDDEDYDLIKNYNWRLNNKSNKYTYYAHCMIYDKSKYIKSIHIHRLIMGLGDYKNDKRIVNHINGNGLDNRKVNLEICNHMYNSQSINKPHQSFGSVSFCKTEKRKKRWRACITLFGISYSKRFITKQEALMWICMKELLYNKK